MADLFAKIFKDKDLEVDFLYPMGTGRPAVIGKSLPENPQKTLMFEMHLDTVGVADMTVDPFNAVVKDGKIFGRGSCDMKGSMAALFHALTPERIQSLSDRGIQLILLGAPDEETGLGGSMKLAAEGMGADYAVVLEPTGCNPVIAHKGAFWYEVELRGRSGHGSQPHTGVSTHTALAEFLPALLNIHQKLADTYHHPVLGTSTLNIGKITGGQTFNIIPERTLLLLDRRVIPNEPAHLFQEKINHTLSEMVKKGSLLGSECRLSHETVPFATPNDTPLVTSLKKSIETITGQPAHCSGTSWVSDASPFSKTCGEIIVFGPGDIAQAHTDNEFIEISQVEKASRIFGKFLDCID